jgi:hypothetical protein
MAGKKDPSTVARIHARIATGAALAMSLVALVLFAQCEPLLDLRSRVEEAVMLSKIGLVLYDGGTRVLPGRPASWDETIFGEARQKLFTLRNDGSNNVSLSAPNIVVNNGGPGAAAFGGIVQPLQLVLAPGDSTTFGVTFTPPSPDADYDCDFVVNSDDSSWPAYHFTVSGHSTQWHGRLDTVSSPVSSVIDNPQVFVDGSEVFLSFMPPAADTNDIVIRKSTDGGKTWVPFAAAAAGAPFHHVLGSKNGEPHVFHYKDTATTGVHYGKWLASTTSWHSGIESRSSTSKDSTVDFHGSMLVASYVFLAWYDLGTTSLLYNFSIDPRAAYPSGVIDSFMTNPVTLAGGGSGRSGGLFPCLRSDSAGNLYVLYADNSGTPGRLWILKTSASNLSFSTLPAASAGPQAAGNAIINQCQLLLTESGSTVTAHAFWSQGYDTNAIYHSSSADLVSWTVPSRLGPDQNNRYGKTLPAAVDGDGVIHVLHENGYGPVGLVLSSSADGGATWVHRTIDDDASFSTYSSSLSLAVSGRTIYAAYSTGSAHANGYSITLMKSLDGGANW